LGAVLEAHAPPNYCQANSRNMGHITWPALCRIFADLPFLEAIGFRPGYDGSVYILLRARCGVHRGDGRGMPILGHCLDSRLAVRLSSTATVATPARPLLTPRKAGSSPASHLAERKGRNDGYHLKVRA
jgi:hypothetical protein